VHGRSAPLGDEPRRKRLGGDVMGVIGPVVGGVGRLGGVDPDGILVAVGGVGGVVGVPRRVVVMMPRTPVKPPMPLSRRHLGQDHGNVMGPQHHGR